MLSRMDRTGKYFTADNFALHYWDWTDDDESSDTRVEQERDKIWLITGHNMNIEGDISGRFAHWNVLCKGHERELCENNADQLCNPIQSSSVRIQRTIGRAMGKQCLARTFNGAAALSSSNRNDLITALNEDSFDEDPYWFKTDNRGFRNALEGFKDLGNNRDEVCPNLDLPWPFFELHNRLHVYIGGTMADIVISSNDPIFYLHHSNVDRMYEMWLQRHNGPYEPEEFSYLVAPGHNLRETLVMLFPPITNEDVHRRSNELGYTYDSLEVFDNKGFVIHSVQKVISYMAGYNILLAHICE